MSDDWALEQHLVKVSEFTKTEHGFTHISGLRVYVGRHRWTCDHDTEGWTETGILDNLEDLEKIFIEYGVRMRLPYDA